MRTEIDFVTRRHAKTIAKKQVILGIFDAIISGFITMLFIGMSIGLLYMIIG
jgi:hypothetical protein